MAMTTYLRLALRYAWASPATFLGMLFSVVALVFGASARCVDGAIEVAGGRIHRCIPLLPRFFRFDAITFGHVIIGVDHAVLIHARRHEHVHVRQYERWGILFFPLYLGSSLVQLVQGRDPYLHNHFEREARAKASAMRK
jgi:hypothetical protein